MKHNASIYGLNENQQYQIVERDFLKLESYHDILDNIDEVNTDLIRFPTENK